MKFTSHSKKETIDFARKIFPKIEVETPVEEIIYKGDHFATSNFFVANSRFWFKFMKFVVTEVDKDYNAITSSKISSIPIPVFSEHGIASLASIPIMFSIWSLTVSGSAAGRSILFKTGIISWF